MLSVYLPILRLDVVFIFLFFLITQVVPMLIYFRLCASDIINALRPLERKCGFLFSLVLDASLVLLKNKDIFIFWFDQHIYYDLVLVASI